MFVLTTGEIAVVVSVIKKVSLKQEITVLLTR